MTNVTAFRVRDNDNEDKWHDKVHQLRRMKICNLCIMNLIAAQNFLESRSLVSSI